MTATRSLAASRLDIVDAFRGFALAGIVFVHMLEQYLGARPPPDFFEGLNSGFFDQFLMGINQMFFVGKFFALFSLLFGLSFFIQMRRADEKGQRFEGRFAWRLIILLAIGYVHSLFYRGDILTIYALLGLALIAFYRVRSGTLLVWIAIIFCGLPRIVVFSYTGGDALLPYGSMAPELPLNQAYFAAITGGTLWDVMALNAWHGHLTKWEFQLSYFGRAYLTFGFFLIGLLLGRIGLFERPGDFRPAIRKTLWISIPGAVVCFIATGVLFGAMGGESGPPEFDSWLAMAALTAYDLANLGVTIMMACIFLLVFLKPRGSPILGRLAPYGRMALSNYVLQTVIGTFLLYHWGLGLIGTLGNTAMFLIAAAVILVQVWVSIAWLRRFQFGPLEWLWRSATKLQWQALVRRPTSRPTPEV